MRFKLLDYPPYRAIQEHEQYKYTYLIPTVKRKDGYMDWRGRGGGLALAYSENKDYVIIVSNDSYRAKRKYSKIVKLELEGDIIKVYDKKDGKELGVITP